MLPRGCFLLCASLWLVACGDDTSRESTNGTGGGGGSSSGAGATGSGGTPGCPETMPDTGEVCLVEGQSCSYGDCCPAGATCTDGHWETWTTDCAEQACPEVPPVAGDSCICFSSPTCAYDNCAADGTSLTATCDGTAWQVESEQCATVVCGTEGLRCNPGELCVSHAGGPGISYACTANPCPNQPVSCECAGARLCGEFECAVVSAQEISCSCFDCP